MSPFPLHLPEAVARRVSGAAWCHVSLGCTRAEVYRFDNGLYLKAVERDLADEVYGDLEGEFLRLQALGARVPVPKVEVFDRGATRDYLLMTELAGRDAQSRLSSEAIPDAVRALADACRLLHAADARGFPFAGLVQSLIEQARGRLQRGLVNAADFDAERAGRSPHELFDELCRLAPRDGESVLTHGDLSPANIIVEGERVVGFVDVGRAALGDPWRDLALCARSIEHDCGARWCEEFLRMCGVERDEQKLSFYTLLDEFF